MSTMENQFTVLLFVANFCISFSRMEFGEDGVSFFVSLSVIIFTRCNVVDLVGIFKILSINKIITFKVSRSSGIPQQQKLSR